MKLELEFPVERRGGDDAFPNFEQGIDGLTFTTKDGVMYFEGWYDVIAPWGAEVTFTVDQRRELAEALLRDLP